MDSSIFQKCGKQIVGVQSTLQRVDKQKLAEINVNFYRVLAGQFHFHEGIEIPEANDFVVL